MFGIRMCPDCPHCCKSEQPCQNIFGSSAEPQGGAFGRCDAIFSAVETQRSGTLHLHGFAFLQRAHQHKTLLEIATMLEQGLLSTADLKDYHCRISRETYPDLAAHEAEADEIEQDWPTFKSDSRLGRLPGFVWHDQGPHILSDGVEHDSLMRDGAEWSRRYDEAAQYRMARLQHHMHTKAAESCPEGR